MFTSWGVHIAGRNWLFARAVEKLSRHCPATEYQHKQGRASNISCGIQKNYRHQHCIKICQNITLQKGEWQQPQMARRTLGDFHINLQSPLSISYDHSFNRKLFDKLSYNLALCRLSCLNRRGGDRYALAACTGNQAIYQGASAPHLFHWLYDCTWSGTCTVSVWCKPMWATK